MSPEELKLVKSVDVNTYEALKKVLCPYCDQNLPTVLKGWWSGYKWVHSIPGTGNEWDCLASKLRDTRGDK